MSITYVRELLKISLSELCHVIGYDSISEMSLDILVDVCEKQFDYLFKQTTIFLDENHFSNQFNFMQICFLLFEQHFDNIHLFNQYLNQFQSRQFPKQILRFPFQKKNQLCLRIPPENSQEILQRDQNANTQHIFHWLPLFPHRKFHFLSLFFFLNFVFLKKKHPKKLFKSIRRIHLIQFIQLIKRNFSLSNSFICFVNRNNRLKLVKK